MKSVFLFASVALCALSAPALAQDANPQPAADDAAADPLGMNEIVVTAQPRAVNKLDSSVSVSSLGAAAIAEAAPRTTAEIFRSIPGIRSESTGGDGNANIAVRGLPVASGGAKFLQLQEDGMPVMQFGDIAFGNADIFLRADQTIASIQAVRGGSASTLASNAPGGVINFISNTGEKDGGVVMATAGVDYEDYRVDFDYGGHIDDKTTFNVGGFWRSGEGPRDAGYTANRGYQIKANLTRKFDAGYVRVYFKHLDDHAISYLPMPTRVTGTNANPTFGSIDGFDIKSDTIQSAYFTSATGLDGQNNRRTTNLKDGMRPLVNAVGLEAVFDVADGLKLEERFRYQSVKGRFVSPFPAEIGGAQGIADSTGNYLANGSFSGGAAGAYSLQYATGPNAGKAFTGGANGLAMRTHLFNVDINDFGGFTNDLKLTKTFGDYSLTAGLYNARQTIDMDWVWDSFLMEVNGHNAALLNVMDNASGKVLSQNGLYAYGVPFWGNCCTRSYNVDYDIIAPYAAFNAQVGPVNFDASIRYDSVKARGDYAGATQAVLDVNQNGTIDPTETSVSVMNNGAASPVNYNVHYVSWSVGANYRVSNDLAVFARASRGGRANADRLLFGLIQPDGSVRKADAINYVNQYELGVKLRSGPFALFLTGFHAKTQEQNFEATSQRFFSRVYKATGLELEAAYRKGIFDLRAGATYTHATIAKDAITPANEGNRPRRQAELLYSFTPALDFGAARVGFNVIGTTKAFAQDNNQLVFPAYAQVNAFVNVHPVDNVEVSLNANNLFNATGITEAEEGAIVDNATNFVRARSINGRTISASVKYTF
ncbi:TonB-dependent receptor [Novosphingobium sp. KCTC 2891]|uniref:TonB-dependent receptor n=1 Tax=Novosphingobium sp. KCTC 2891 TaxID=2989730 RepID=UPI002221D099|nr:TonB-dependent receptor [Novosphingobium sp. KCTC 2891]MCW1381925.1 TonB-dependent receptor [Novosphingobium sp. KCTC 2891]